MRQLRCEGLLFDLDGVLIDSSSCITRHWKKWADLHGLELADVMRNAHGLRTVETIRIVAPHLDADQEAERFTAGELLDTEGVRAIEGAQPLLESLPADRWAIVTSGNKELATVRLRKAELPIPRMMVSGDEVSRGKPAPDPYLEGARRLGLPADLCIAVEDAPAGIVSARAAGMQVVAIASTHPKQDLNCPVVVDRLTALHIELRAGHAPCLLVCVEL